jgi:hypothetical protein
VSGIEFISVGCRCVCDGVWLNSTAGAIRVKIPAGDG